LIHDGEYGLVNIHRFETLHSAQRRTAVKRTLLKASETHKLIMVSHETTRSWLEREPAFIADLERNGGLWLPRQPFTRFAHWLGKAQFVIADSGGNQQECSFLGIPCLLLRDVTELAPVPGRTCVVLSRFDESVIDRFLSAPESYRQTRQDISVRPSDCIWRALSEE
jgi:UDP-N-acetylglucosamine 2-epimerase (non-hydrolysing)